MSAYRIGDRIVHAMEAVGAASLVILMVTVFVDVVGRNIFNTPLPWGTELLEMVLALMIFALYPLLALGFEHITVDLIQVRPGLRAVQRVLSSAIGALMFALIAWCMGRQAIRAAEYGEATPLLNVPLSWVLGGIAVLAAISGLAFVQAAVRTLRQRGAPDASNSTKVI